MASVDIHNHVSTFYMKHSLYGKAKKHSRGLLDPLDFSLRLDLVVDHFLFAVDRDVFGKKVRSSNIEHYSVGCGGYIG